MASPALRGCRQRWHRCADLGTGNRLPIFRRAIPDHHSGQPMAQRSQGCAGAANAGSRLRMRQGYSCQHNYRASPLNKESAMPARLNRSTLRTGIRRTPPLVATASLTAVTVWVASCHTDVAPPPTVTPSPAEVGSQPAESQPVGAPDPQPGPRPTAPPAIGGGPTIPPPPGPISRGPRPTDPGPMVGVPTTTMSPTLTTTTTPSPTPVPAPSPSPLSPRTLPDG